MPLGNLDDRYLSQTLQLRTVNTALAAASTESGQRSWMVPDLGTGDLTVPGLAKAFDRSTVADNYSQILTSQDGTDGDAMAAKLQSDHLAAQERAYRLRSAGPVRCGLHAAARRAAHGMTNGVFGRVDSYVQDLLLAGSAGFVEG